MSPSWLLLAVALLAAAVLGVLLATRLRLGAVLGYLIAGVIIGPRGLAWVGDIDRTMDVAELGVVLLLFVIGLELQPSRLWALRRPIFGFGSAQVVFCGGLLAIAGFAIGLPPAAAVVVGFALSLSSTALVLQLLAENKQLTTHHGRTAFAVLLFQDLAAIPMLAVLPMLGGSAGDWHWRDAAIAAGALGAVVLLGRPLLRPGLRLAASAANHDVFVAATLLVVVGTALIMRLAGLSMALGAFLAGVLLADSEFRHELEADIEPFKGLLLGLFFIAVGMSVDIGLVLHQPLIVLGLTLGFMTIKAAAIYVLARVAKHGHETAANLALHISQGGEFAFVLFGVAVDARVLDRPWANLLVLAVSLSMAVTPLLAIAGRRWIAARPAASPPYDKIEAREHRVVIAGFGRFGQVVGRILRMKKIPFTVLEASFEQVAFVRKFGNEIHFGDASRLDLLRAARLDQADVFVLAIDDIDVSVKTAALVRAHYPRVKILARARNRLHAYRLMDAGVEQPVRETFLSSIELARDTLLALGNSRSEADRAAAVFRRHDEALLHRQHQIHEDEAQLIAATRQGATELERLFEEDSEASAENPR